MKNLNLTGLFLGMVERFNVSGFEITSIKPKDGEIIDALIVFKNAKLSEDDLSDIYDTNKIVFDNIGEERDVVGSFRAITPKIINNNQIQLYIEFVTSEFLDTLD